MSLCFRGYIIPLAMSLEFTIVHLLQQSIDTINLSAVNIRLAFLPLFWGISWNMNWMHIKATRLANNRCHPHCFWLKQVINSLMSVYTLWEAMILPISLMYYKNKQEKCMYSNILLVYYQCITIYYQYWYIHIVGHMPVNTTFVKKNVIWCTRILHIVICVCSNPTNWLDVHCVKGTSPTSVNTLFFDSWWKLVSI